MSEKENQSQNELEKERSVEKDAFTQADVQEPYPDKMMRSRVHFQTLLFVIPGLLSALYALIEFVRLKSSSGLGTGCLIKQDTTCGGLVVSNYGTLFAIPIGALGLAFWCSVGVLAFMPKHQKLSKSFFIQLRAFLAGIGFAYVLWLFYVGEFVGDISCSICSLFQVVIGLFFIYSILSLMFRRFGTRAINHLNLRKVALAFSAATLPFFLLGGGFSLYLNFAKSKKASTENLVVVDDAFPKEWWAVEPGDSEGNGADYRAGNDSGSINVQLFTDPTSEDAWRTQAAIGTAMQQLAGDKILFVIKFLPQDAECNRYAESQGVSCRLAVAARCAGRQGRFFEFLNWEYEAQLKPILERDAYYSEAGLRYQAERFGLNVTEFNACVGSTIELLKIRDDVENAKKMDASEAPFVIINGKPFEGDYGEASSFLEAFSKISSK